MTPLYTIKHGIVYYKSIRSMFRYVDKQRGWSMLSVSWCALRVIYASRAGL